MKAFKISAWAILGFILGTFTIGVIADTTWTWSEPGQKGTLTYTGLGITTPTFSGTASGSLAGLTLTGGAFNGTVGATTPAAGKFTTVNASSTMVVTGLVTGVGGFSGVLGATGAANGTFTTVTGSTFVVGTTAGLSKTVTNQCIGATQICVYVSGILTSVTDM